MRRKHKKLQFKELLLKHINNNIKEYLSVCIVFFIGIVLGVVFINNIKEPQQTEITNYINNFVNSLKNNNVIDKGLLIKDSIQKNLVLGLSLWFVGSTVIGIPIVYGIIGYRGFCIGYTISASIAVLGNGKGILFAIFSILSQNLVFIPCILALGVSGIKLYKSILKDKRRENIKIEIYRHTIFSVFITFMLIVSSLIEVYVSTNVLQIFIKYI